VIPEITPGMTATTAELLLNQIMTTIARGRFRYVGITATDARDRIFLAGYIRKVCPDVQLLIIESDLLFTHPESRSFMKGAIIASSYAVTQQGRLGPDERGRPGGKHIEFPTDYCQGMYNAAIILKNYEDLDLNFDSADWANGPAGESLQHELRGYETMWFTDRAKDQKKKRLPDAVRQPGIWLSIVGNDELWPLQHCSIESTAERLFDLDATSVLSSAPQSTPECLPSTSEQDLRELLNYTFSTWPSHEVAKPEDRGANDKLPNAERNDSGPSVRTHLDAFDRTVFCVVLFFGLYEVTQHSRKKSFWGQFQALRLPKTPDFAQTRIAAVTWFVLQAVAVLAVTSFATWLSATRLSDEVDQFPPIGRIWWLLRAAVGLFELAGIVWVNSEEVGRRLPKWRFWLLFVAGACCLVTFLSLVIRSNQHVEDADEHVWNCFLLSSDLLLFVFGCLVTAGIVRFLAWEILAAVPPKRRKGITTRFFRRQWQKPIKNLVVVIFAPRCRNTITALVAVGVAVLLGAAETYVDAQRPGVVFFYERCAHALNGVSLWSAFLFLAGAFYLLSYQHEQGLLLDKEGPPPKPPWPDLSKDTIESHSLIKNLTSQFDKSRQALSELLCQPIPRLLKDHSGSLWALVGVIVLWSAMLVTKVAPWMYDSWFSAVYWLVLSLFFWVWVFWLYSIVTYLKELERLFDRITTLPLLDSFKRLPDSLAPYFGRVLFRIHHLRTDDRRIAITYLNTLAQRKDPIATAVAKMRDAPQTNWSRAFEEELTGKRLTGEKLSGQVKRPCRDALNAVAQELWKNSLIDEWRTLGPDSAFAISGIRESEGNPVREESTVLRSTTEATIFATKTEHIRESKESTVDKHSNIDTIALADDFILIQLISYCNPLLRHAWRSCVCVAIATLLFLLAIASYAAQPQGFFGTTAVGMIILLGVLTGTLVWRTERSELLSRFSGTTPGKVQFDWSFVIQVIVLFLIPVLVLINYAFPGSFDWLSTLLAPLFHVMK